MAVSLSKYFFVPTLLLSVFFALSSSSIFMIWVGLELNMISLLPLLSFEGGSIASEVIMKYFLTQAWASSLFILGVLLVEALGLSLLVEISMLIKLGAAPVHLWFISVMRKCSYFNLFLLSTLQKVIPLLVLSYLFSSVTVEMGVLMSAVVAGWGVYNHTSVRAILAYSSVFTVAWCLSGVNDSVWVWAGYLLIYTLSLAVLLTEMVGRAGTTLSSLSVTGLGGFGSLGMFTVLCAMGGLPPLVGFWAKLLVLNSLVLHGKILASLVLVMAAVWILYLYIRLSFANLVFGFSGQLWNTRSSGEGTSLSVILLVALPALLSVPMGLLSSSMREILIFKILERSKLST